jgi:GNAT superfamily N-acetyltransferase
VSQSELSAAVERCLEGEVRMFGRGSPGSRVLELPGVVAGLTPATPQRSLFNSIFYREPQALLAAWPELERTYAAEGVRAFTVWLRPSDTALATELARLGHVLDGRVVGMAAELAELSLPGEDGLAWRLVQDCRIVGAINDASYTLTLPAFQEAVQSFVGAAMPATLRAYVASQSGRDVACLCAHDEPDGVLGISLVATLPDVRGRGLASRLLAVALRDGARRGLRSTALVASSLGRGVYARLGYREVGGFEMWERRTL